jgi:murein DD-endopeptidase MepM/ murein hydrolase activator NlpD
MARVPDYQPQPIEVRTGGERFSAPDMGAGTAELAQGVEQLGQAVGQFQAEHMKVAAMSADAQAHEQSLTGQQDMTKVLTDFTQLQGGNAVQGQKAAIQSLQGIYDNGLKAMSTPMMQKFYATRTAPMLAVAQAKVNEHAVTQVTAQKAATLRAQVQLDSDTAAASYADPKAFAQGLSAVRNSAVADGQFQGLADAALQDHVRERVGGAVLSAISLAVTANSAPQAVGLYKAFAGDLTMAQRNDAMRLVAKPLEDADNANLFALAATGHTAAPSDPLHAVNGQPDAVPAPGAAPVKAVQTPTVAAPNATYQAPTSGGKVSDSYAAHLARGSHGVDFPAPLGSAIKPVAAGVVTVGKPDARSGQWVEVKHPDGSTTTYAHMGNISVHDGQEVGQSDVLGTVGMTGHTTGPHVHLRMRDAQGNDVDPAKVIGKQPDIVAPSTAPRLYDVAAILTNIRAMGLGPEREARAIEYARNRAGSDRSAIEQNYADAKESAGTYVDAYIAKHNGEYPTSLPQSVLAPLKPSDAAAFNRQLAEAAKRKSDEAVAKAQMKTDYDLQLKMYEDHDGFLNTNLNDYAGRLSPSGFQSLRLEQARLKAQAAKPQTWEPYSETVKAYNTFATFNQDAVPKSSGKNDEDFVRRKAVILETMKAKAAEMAGQGKRPTDSDWQNIARSAVASAQATVTMSRGSKKAVYDLTVNDLPTATVDYLRRQLRDVGVGDPTDADIIAAYAETVNLARPATPSQPAATGGGGRLNQAIQGSVNSK